MNIRPHIALCLAAAGALLLCPPEAAAQRIDNRTIMSRIDRMEQDIMLVQRQLAQQGVPAGAYGGGADADGGAGAARAQAGLAALTEDLRRLRGQIEEQDYRTRALQERLDRLAQDLEYRLAALEGRPGQPAAPENAEASGPFASPAEEAMPAPPAATPAPPAPQDTGGSLKLPEPPGSAPASPREHYNQAFRLLNQTRYEEAGRQFKSFIESYPDNPLVGNAWYWLGESQYVRRDYVQAADSFRQGFEKLPDGPKAADNLLKLGMSLSALGRGKEACVVLRQLRKKYGDNSASIRQKAEQELSRVGCE